MSAPLNVTIDALSSMSGGARTYLRAMLPLLASRGARLSVVCRASQERDFGLSPPLSGVQVVRAPESTAPLAARLAYSAAMVPRVCVEQNADVLFCPTDYAPPYAPCATTLMIRNPTPYVRGLSTVAGRSRRAREAGMRLVTRLSAMRSERVILVSRAAWDATAAVISLPQHRVRVVHHGRDPRFAPPSSSLQRDPNLILAVSSIYAFKNYPILLEAMVMLRDLKGLRPRLAIAGAAFDHQHALQLERQVISLGLSSQVRFLGEVPHGELIDWYRRAGVFVMPSKLETFGHPYIEAMATGTAAVVADIPCAREICGDAVRYFPSSSPKHLAETLMEVMENADLRQRLELAGPERASQFSWERCADDTLAVLREAVDVRRQAR